MAERDENQVDLSLAEQEEEEEEEEEEEGDGRTRFIDDPNKKRFNDFKADIEHFCLRAVYPRKAEKPFTLAVADLMHNYRSSWQRLQQLNPQLNQFSRKRLPFKKRKELFKDNSNQIRFIANFLLTKYER